MQNPTKDYTSASKLRGMIQFEDVLYVEVILLIHSSLASFIAD
jgi:hypothetical protein